MFPYDVEDYMFRYDVEDCGSIGFWSGLLSLDGIGGKDQNLV